MAELNQVVSEEEERIESLRKMVHTLEINETKIPREILLIQYKKPYDRLRENIKKTANEILSERISQIRIQRNAENEKLEFYLLQKFDKAQQLKATKELSHALFTQYDVKQFCQILNRLIDDLVDICFDYWEKKAV